MNWESRVAASIPTARALMPGSEHRGVWPAGLNETEGRSLNLLRAKTPTILVSH